MRICSIKGCNEKHAANGYCRSHNYRYKRYGDPLEVRQIQSKNTDGKCKIKDCKRKHYAKGYCKFHRYRWERYGDPLYVKISTCSMDGCDKPIEAKGLCQMHYKRLRVHGDPSVTKISYNTPCIIEGCKNMSRRNGYCEEHYFKSDLARERHRMYSANRRSIQANAPINDHTLEDWEDALETYDHKCAYCGDGEQLEQDHIVPLTKNGEHTKTNIIPACRSCNSSKRQRLLENWYPKQPFYKREKEEKIHRWMNG